METILTTETHAQSAPTTAARRGVMTGKSADDLAALILDILDEQSAADIVQLDLRGKSSICDYMIVASGRSNRHVSALADYVQRGLKEIDIRNLGVEGMAQCDWVLIDVGDVIVHLFRPEVREFYALEKMWSVPPIAEDA